jgi:hypothetical protein
MKLIIKTEDPKEIMRHVKALDMAIVLFEFSHNAMRRFKHSDVEVTADDLMKLFHILLDEQGIKIEDIIE